MRSNTCASNKKLYSKVFLCLYHNQNYLPAILYVKVLNAAPLSASVAVTVSTDVPVKLYISADMPYSNLNLKVPLKAMKPLKDRAWAILRNFVLNWQ